MFGKWFKKGGGQTAPRQLERPDQLRVGDMIDLVDSFGLPEQLRGQTLQVTKVSTYVDGPVRTAEFLLQGDSSEPIHMSFEQEDGEQSLLFTRKIPRGDVETLLDMEAFGQVFGDETFRGQIKAADAENRFARWVGESYYQQGGWSHSEYFEKDLRSSGFGGVGQRGEPCESLTLMTAEGDFFIDIEVWDGGETDVSLGIVRPLSDLSAFYGKS